MSQQVVARRDVIKKLMPAYRPELALERHANFAPSLTLALGTVLGKYSAAADAVQTIADSGTVSGGTFTISGVNPITEATFTTAAIAYNAANATVKAAIEAVIGNGITVTVAGSGLPGNDTTITVGGNGSNLPIQLMTIDSASLTGTNPVLAITNTTIGRTANTFKAYSDGNSDGSEVARGILPWAIVTDAQGKITIGGGSTGNEWGSKQDSIPIYVGGYFKTAELTGLDAAAVVDLGRLVEGVLATGVLKIN